MFKIQLHDLSTPDIHYVVRDYGSTGGKLTSLYVQSNQVGSAKVSGEAFRHELLRAQCNRAKRDINKLFFIMHKIEVVHEQLVSFLIRFDLKSLFGVN